MPPSSNESILLRTHCAHISGWRILEYTLRVCWMRSDSSRARDWVVARVKRWISFPLMVGMLKSQSKGLNSKMFWNDSMDSWSDATVVKPVRVLNRAVPSEWVGMFPNCVKMVSLRAPLMEPLTQLNIVLAFWIALWFTLAVRAVTICASVTEW